MATTRMTGGADRSGARLADVPAERVAVWHLLSELYLDTAHDAGDLQRLARELARSPYGVAELRAIETWEVAPVVHSNLHAVAGVWDGFDRAWLETECRRRAAGRSPGLRLAAWLGWERRVRRATAAAWRHLEPMIVAARGEAAARAPRDGGTRPDPP